MKSFDLCMISDHVDKDRRARFSMIEKTIGFGSPIVETGDKKPDGDCTRTLTDTGVILVIDPYGIIVTAFIASVKQASRLYKQATGDRKLPQNLFNMVNYNNNTEYWKKMAA